MPKEVAPGAMAGRAHLLRRLQRQRQVTIIHGLGARVLFEFLDEVDRHYGLGDDFDRRLELERYADLDIGMLQALGGDKFPPSPLRAVEGGK